MPILKANQRRRRLRLIKSIEDHTAKQFRSAVSALTIASDTECARLDGDAIRQKLLAECRVKTASVLRIEHPGAPPLDVAMNRPYLLVGSDPACDVRLEHAEIKPRHCFLQWIDGYLFCSNIGQISGYFPRYDSQSNGRWIDHQPVTIGPYQFSLIGNESALCPDFFPLDRSARLAGEFPYLGLHFDGVEQADNVWPVNRVLTMIGRAPQCKLRLNHQSMAFVQAALLRTSTGCWLVDIAQDGKTCVNGRPIQASPIDIGDEIEFGSFRADVVTMGTASVVPAAKGIAANEKFGIAADKPLPPIRFDRKSAQSSDDSPVVRVTPSHELVETMVPATAVAETTVSATSIAEFASEPDVGMIAIEDLKQAEVIPSSKPLPPIRFDRQPSRLSGEPLISRVTPGSGPAETVIPATAVAETANTKLEVAHKGQVIDENSQQGDSTVTQPSDPAANAATPGQPKIDLEAAPTLVAEFLKQQQSELDSLKKQLNELKKIYDAAAGQMISKKMRDSLEKPVIETMQCHDSMQEKLEQLRQQIER